MDLFNNLKNLMPGDTRTETVVVKNTSTDYDYVKIYLRAEPVSTTANATASGDITMSDFLNQLTLSVYNGDELISTSSAAEPGTLSDNLNLGTFYPGDSTTLSVTVTAPTNLSNKYAHATGDIVWIFTTEAYKDNEPVSTVPDVNVDAGQASPNLISLTVSNSTTPAQNTSSSAQATSSSTTTVTTASSSAQSTLVLNLNTTPINPWLIAFLVSILIFFLTTFVILIKHKKAKPTL